MTTTSRLNPISVAIISFFGFIALVLALSAYQLGSLGTLEEHSRRLNALQPESLATALRQNASDEHQVWISSETRRIGAQLKALQAWQVAEGSGLPQVRVDELNAIASTFAALQNALSPTSAQLDAFTGAVGTAVSNSNAVFTKRVGMLRWFQWFALATGALLLAGLVFHLFREFGQEERAVATSQQETKHILSTVNEGLFLLNRELKIGAEFSGVTTDILRRSDLAGLGLEQLLADMVPERTQNLALDFVRLLWSDHVEAELVDDINPLGEVEVHLRGADGQFDTRHLKFGFKRVAEQADGDILVSVTDITEAVKMRQDLEKARAESEAQMDLLMSILHVDASQLQAFLADSTASLQSVNAVLQTPASKHEEFKDKIDSIFRTVHSIKSDSAALGLPSIESKAHGFEDDLQALRAMTTIGGRDLLGLPIKLDELLSHFASIESLVGRLTSLRSAFASAPQTVAPVTDSTAKSGAPRETPATAAPKAAATAADSPRLAVTQKLHPSQLPPQELGLGAHLNAVVARVSGDLQKRAELLHVGLDDIPQQVTGPLKEALVQLVRNAVVHGLEVPAARTRAGKNELGKVTVTCQRDANGIEIRVEDDGLGISASRIRETAVARKLVTVEEAAQLQGGKLLGLLFKPGFSTAEPGNQHAGRGVGLDVVVDAIKRVGGRVGLSTKPGLGTKFTIRLPLADARHAA